MLERERQVAEIVLGPCGRMVGASKTRYRERHPDHAVIFNANVCTGQGKVWFGDLDLTLDEPLLFELAKWLGDLVFVLWERDGRFENAQKPRLDRAVAVFGGSGAVDFDERRLRRAEDRTLRMRTREEREARHASDGE